MTKQPHKAHRFDFVSQRRTFFVASTLVLLAAMAAMVVFGFQTGIDFSGGSVIEVEGETSIEQIKEAAETAGIFQPTITTSGTNRYLVRYSSGERDAEVLHQEAKATFEAIGLTELRFDNVGPSVSRDVVRNAITSIVVMSFAIIAFIAYSFRKMPPPLRPSLYGVIAVVALLHDAIFVMGAFALLGAWLGVEIDSFFVTAILTVIGFSVHDTIVIFDRVRENLKGSRRRDDFGEIVNRSIYDNLRRSINTSVVLLLVLVALFFFGGASIRYFVLALILGMVSGTYSSIFIAAPLLVTVANYLEARDTKPSGKTSNKARKKVRSKRKN